MPYKIQHKSQNSCVIKYKKDKRSRRKKRYDMTLFVCFIIMVLMGVDILFAGAMWLAAGIVLGALQPPYVNFEIELNRQKNRIYIRSKDQPRAKTASYPLSDLGGIGVRNLKRSQADLFLKIRSEQDGFQKIPVRKLDHPVPRENAETIAEAVEEWLRLTDETQMIEESVTPDDPPQEEEIFRDFRDMDN